MENILVKRKTFDIVKEIISKDDHISYECVNKNKKYFVKVYNNLEDYEFEIKSYKDFSSYGIRNPKLLRKDKKTLSIVYEFVDGIKALDVIADGTIDDSWYEKLFLIYRFARFSKIDINYLPEHFVLYKNELYYLNHYFFEQDSSKNLENYGLDYWIYGTKCVEHLKEFGYEIDKKRILSKPDVNKKIVLLSIMKW